MKNPWVRYDFHRCEMCHRRRFKTVEVGFYWVCTKPQCIKYAMAQLKKDIEEWDRGNLAKGANNKS
jgi:ribosomal protein L37AE/L43A